MMKIETKNSGTKIALTNNTPRQLLSVDHSMHVDDAVVGAAYCKRIASATMLLIQIDDHATGIVEGADV